MMSTECMISLKVIEIAKKSNSLLTVGGKVFL